jgi:hypothetical protein
MLPFVASAVFKKEGVELLNGTLDQDRKDKQLKDSLCHCLLDRGYLSVADRWTTTCRF